MRVGLVGLGSIGRRHLGNLLALGADVVAMDVSPEAIEKARAAYPHARYGDSLPFAGLDALVIATPLDSHLPWVEEAVARRVPFFVEKPLGTLEQLPRWRALAAMDLPVNQVGYNWRFNNVVVAYRASRSGCAPPLEIGCCTDIASWPGRYGDPLLECSHEIDLVQWWYGGMPRLESASRLDKGVAVHFENACVVAHWGKAESRTNKRMRLQAGAARAKLIAAADDSVRLSYVKAIAHFLDCVHEGTPTICPLVDGLKVLEVCRQIEQVAA
jgi:predicted dehydrogenase